jgi:SAM-dependent methyltransferase
MNLQGAEFNICPVCRESAANVSDELAYCSACDHVYQVPPIVTVRYDRQYLAKYEHYPTREMSLLRLGMLKTVVCGGRLLDVGHGTGEFVRLAESAGFEAFGCDVHGVDVGIQTINLDADLSRWDVTCLFDSVEHFVAFDVIRDLFVRSRVVMISTPRRPNSLYGIDWWRHYKPGEHLHYFSRKSLLTLVGKPIRFETNAEDVIRRYEGVEWNVLTMCFG